MKKQTVSLLLKYGITTLVGALMVWAVIDFHGLSMVQSAMDRYRILSDAFTIPGVVLMLCWVLVFVSNEGVFEGISYSLSYAVKMLFPGGGRRTERYSEYIERRREKGRVKGVGFLFITGAVFFSVALIFIALFYREYNA